MENFNNLHTVRFDKTTVLIIFTQLDSIKQQF